MPVSCQPVEVIDGTPSKRCLGCKEMVPLERFNTNSRNGQTRSKCKTCLSVWKKAYTGQNEEKVKESRRRYKQKNRERELERGREYRRKNAAKIKASRDACPKTAHTRLQKTEYAREWRKNNAERFREAHRVYAQKKRQTSPEFKIEENLRRRIRGLVTKEQKSGSTLTLLGCTSREFKTYLESLWLPGMSWDNYGVWKEGGPMKWHIDHIKPCIAFNLLDPEQQKQCFHYSNMQPLWALDNIRKHGKWNPPT